MLVTGKLANKANVGDYGSSRIRAPYVVSQLEGFKNYLGNTVEVIYYDESDIEKAKKAAAIVDCVIIIAGNDYNDERESVVPDEQSNISMEGLILEGYNNQGQGDKVKVDFMNTCDDGWTKFVTFASSLRPPAGCA